MDFPSKNNLNLMFFKMNLKSGVQSRTGTRSSIAHVMHILSCIYDIWKKKTSYLKQERD